LAGLLEWTIRRPAARRHGAGVVSLRSHM
jgi:hypothetical protein